MSPTDRELSVAERLARIEATLESFISYVKGASTLVVMLIVTWLGVLSALHLTAADASDCTATRVTDIVHHDATMDK